MKGTSNASLFITHHSLCSSATIKLESTTCSQLCTLKTHSSLKRERNCCPLFTPFKYFAVQQKFKRKTARLNFKTNDFHRGDLTSHSCFHGSDQCVHWCHWVHKWARLHAHNPRSSVHEPARPRRCFGCVSGGRSRRLPKKETRRKHRSCPATVTPIIGDCLSWNDPGAETRTSRSFDINSYLASPNCGGPLCYARNGAVNCANNTLHSKTNR